MRRTAIALTALVVALAFAVPASAVDFTLDFEDLSDMEAVTNQYHTSYGVIFGDAVTALQESPGSLNTLAGFNAPSGVTVIGTFSPSWYIDVWFDTPVASVDAMYESTRTFYLEAYNGTAWLSTTSGAETYFTGVGHVAQNISVSDADESITRVRFHDAGNYFLVDDLHVTGPDAPPPADDSPEPCTWVLLACTGAAGAIIRRRRKT